MSIGLPTHLWLVNNEDKNYDRVEVFLTETHAMHTVLTRRRDGSNSGVQQTIWHLDTTTGVITEMVIVEVEPHLAPAPTEGLASEVSVSGDQCINNGCHHSKGVHAEGWRGCTVGGCGCMGFTELVRRDVSPGQWCQRAGCGHHQAGHTRMARAGVCRADGCSCPEFMSQPRRTLSTDVCGRAICGHTWSVHRNSHGPGTCKVEACGCPEFVALGAGT